MQNEPKPDAAANDDQAAPPLPSPERIQELLFDAARIGRADIIPALLQAGASLSATDHKGYTPLILASYNGHEDATQVLLAHGALVNQPDEIRRNTALMGVAFKGYDRLALLLIAAGASPHATNGAGQTALMMAAMFGRCAIVDRLLALGSDPELQDVAGNSAVSVAQSQSNDLMVARLNARRSEPFE